MTATGPKKSRTDLDGRRITALLEKLQATSVAIGDRAAVKLYLAAHPDMLGLTEAVCATARAKARPEDALTLDVYEDPEADDRTLQLLIRRAEYDPSIGELISSIVKQHEAAYKGRSGWLGVTTDFRPSASPVAV